MRAVERLVARGHRENDVLNEYSIEKLEAYLDAAEENELDELVQLVRVQHDPKGLLKDAKRMMHGDQGEAIPSADAAKLAALSRGKRKRRK